jgi:amidase
VNDTELCWATAAEQARLVRIRALSARELVEATLRRVEALNPILNAYRTILAEQALAEAEAVDRTNGGDDERPLLGVPVAVKDDTDVAGEITAWGTAAYGDPKPEDSIIVRRLRAAGAIVIGKTNVPELTAWPWTTSETWGSTLNPWDLQRTPGGSSGGSAAAVAAGMCGLATGSDGGGSIRYPAALTGLFGLKPQRDRIPLDADHHDAWNGLLTLGALTRTVQDTALFLDATADRPPLGGYADAVREPLRGLRIAVSCSAPARSMARLGDDHRIAVQAIAQVLRDLGHHVFEQDVNYGNVMANSTVRYLAGVHHDARTMPHPDRLERTTRRLAALGALMSGRSVAHARQSETQIAHQMNEIFQGADLVLTPMTGAAAPALAELAGRGVLRSLRHSNVAAWAVPWNVIGQPAASIPAGRDRTGLPLAVQLCGPRDCESTLLNLAAQIEGAKPCPTRAPIE